MADKYNVVEHDSIKLGLYVLEQIESVCLSLEVEPTRRKRISELV